MAISMRVSGPTPAGYEGVAEKESAYRRENLLAAYNGVQNASGKAFAIETLHTEKHMFDEANARRAAEAAAQWENFKATARRRILAVFGLKP